MVGEIPDDARALVIDMTLNKKRPQDYEPEGVSNKVKESNEVDSKMVENTLPKIADKEVGSAPKNSLLGLLEQTLSGQVGVEDIEETDINKESREYAIKDSKIDMVGDIMKRLKI